jgi:lysine/ornithine N-monooxygenase
MTSATNARGGAAAGSGQPRRLPVPIADGIPPELEHSSVWTDEMVFASGMSVQDCPIVSVGGGMGSFITVNYLRIAGGVPADDIRVLSNLDHPWQTYEYLTRVSQLGLDRRIRSDSQSRPDNLWGFPSYAVQEAVRSKTLKPLLQVLIEPVFADFYTPVLADVITNLEREARRIGYWDMLVQGQVRTIHPRAGGGYYTVLLPFEGQGDKPIAFRTRDVHVAVGYPGVRFLPDLQRFREEMNDFHHVVNGYENHEHVYEALCRRPSTVLVRGSGVAASAILQRLITDRYCKGAQTQILHLFRNYTRGAHGPHPWSRRKGGNGFAYQGFNYPKSSWGGQLKARMRRLDGPDLAEAYDTIEGTTTPLRKVWQHYLDVGRNAGWYQPLAGTLDNLRLQDGAIRSTLRAPTPDQPDQTVDADYIIDCTGLEPDVTKHQVLNDLLLHAGARRNWLGRLDVERNFELRGADNGDGRIYVTGTGSYGGNFPGVDTFLGLQISAQEVADDVAHRGFSRKMGPLRSSIEWIKWARGRQVN